jgi:hypothetical protein
MSKVDEIVKKFKNVNETEVSIDTKPSVDGFECDAIERYGSLEIPVYHVDSGEFNQNFNYGRRRLRFKNDNLQKITQNNLNPVIIKYIDDNGQVLVKKIK